MVKLITALLALVFGSTQEQAPVKFISLCASSLDRNIKYFIQSSFESTVWQAEGVSDTSFSFIDLQPQTQGLNDQLWSIVTDGPGNVFPLASAGPTARSACVIGDDGAIYASVCPKPPNDFEKVPKNTQWVVLCQSCALDNRGATECILQSIGGGYRACASSNGNNTAIGLEDCDFNDPNQLWDFVPSI